MDAAVAPDAAMVDEHDAAQGPGAREEASIVYADSGAAVVDAGAAHDPEKPIEHGHHGNASCSAAPPAPTRGLLPGTLLLVLSLLTHRRSKRRTRSAT
jgi:hypothetical protein